MSAVSVMMEGVYRVGQSFGMSNQIWGCFTCYEGLFRHISDRPSTAILLSLVNIESLL